MFTVIYRWRVRPDMDEQFRRAWFNRTQEIFAARGSYGSALHREDDGTYCAIALWPSREAWQAAEPAIPGGQAGAALFGESIAESLPVQAMTAIDNAWKLPAMLDHISLGVSNLKRSIAFYDTVLAPLGYERLWSSADAAGYGLAGADEPFAVKEQAGGAAVPAGGSHFAFSARSKSAAAQFHRAALECGAADDGGADYHPEYGPGYFAAFARDLDGYRIEAVFHEPLARR